MAFFCVVVMLGIRTPLVVLCASNIAEAFGELVPMPTLPEVVIVIAVVAPLLPTLKLIVSLVPTPDVDCNDNPDDAVVPPITLDPDMVMRR